jgi:AraC family transcriptional regulator
MFGMQPNQWRKHIKIPQRYLMPRLTLKHIQHINKGEYLKPILKKKEAFFVTGLMTLVTEDRRVIPELWDMLVQEVEGVENTVTPQKYYGIVWYPNNWEQRGFFYMAAIEIDSPNIMNFNLVVKTIPALTYARFIHKGFWRDRHLSFDYIYHTWLPKSGKRLVLPLEIECYKQDFRDSDHEESEREIYIPIDDREFLS